MNTEEMKQEHRYRLEERIGILTQGADPTPLEQKIAQDEADLAIQQLKAQGDYERGKSQAG